MKFIAAIAALLTVPTAAVAAPGFQLRARAGVPIPLKIHGYNAQSEGISTRWPVYGGLGVAYQALPRWSVAAEMGVGTLIGEQRDNSARTWFASGGLVAEFQVWSPDSGGGIRLSLGPSVLRNAIVVDENIRLDTWAVGVRGAVRGAWPLNPEWTLDLVVGLESYDEPLNKKTYFNEPLGGTALATLSVGVSFSP